MITLTEVLVHPMRHGDHDLANRYRQILLHTNSLATMPMSDGIAQEAAELRARHSLRTPDAIQLATAICAGAASFLTNDSRLPGVPVLKILVLNQLLGTLP